MFTSPFPDHHFALLMHHAQQGCQTHYHQLLTEIAPYLRSYFATRVPEGEGEDLVQETLLAIHRSSHTFNTERSFKNWMFAIASYKLADFLRDHYRHERRQVNLDEAAAVAIPSDEMLFDDREQLIKILATLPEKQRTILQMLKLEGHSTREVARALGMSETAVKTAAHRALQELAHTAIKEEKYHAHR
ncbi:sigma-70 family RNA polymerase sigma factor [Chrysiogenes arsenatis]|uniref:sigma-70 family RNA polymerase sigma factor n=1 Tax=Chrysiogenes arsenatis TaxID=309797 RepID=UPI00135F1C31|nr:sigma-70 family RNA polymerase sigma factor [Chrysiogenes arsenatis]